MMGLGAATVIALAGCGSAQGGGRNSEAHASLVRAPSSLADVRASSVAVVEGVAGAPVDDTVRTGPGSGAPLTKTPFTVTRVVWGAMPLPAFTVNRVAISEVGDAPLVEGQRYLLFVVQSGIGANADEYSVTMGAGYRLAGDTYVYNGQASGKLPAAIPASSAVQQVTS